MTTDTVNTDGERRRAIFPRPPEPGPEQEDFAPYPRRLTQPSVASGRLMGGVAPTRRGGAETTTTWKPEGEELRPPGPFPPAGEWPVVHHYHHHTVDTVARGHETHQALRIVVDNGQPAYQILPRDSQRVRATILNESSASSGVATPSNLEFGNRPQSGSIYGSGAGFRLVPGASQDVRDSDEVWASVDGTHTTIVSIWVTRNGPPQGENQGF